MNTFASSAAELLQIVLTFTRYVKEEKHIKMHWAGREDKTKVS